MSLDNGLVVNALLEAIRSRLLSQPDTVCLERARLVTEAYQRHQSDPMVLRRAKAFAHVLGRMTLDVDTNPYLAGNTSTGPRAWMVMPEYGFDVPEQAIVENPAMAGHLDGAAIPNDLRAFWKDRGARCGGGGIGHLSVDNERLVSRGLRSVLDEAQSGLDDLDSDRRTFRQACIIGCRAVIEWAHRYADAAQAAAQRAADPFVRSLHQRVARACRHVPENPARDLFEAIQSITLVHLAVHIEGHGYSVSPGRLDQVLAPCDRDEGDALDLLCAFWLKLSANSLWGSHSKTQCITVGGTDGAGRDRCDRLTLLMLEAAAQVRMPDPQLFLRWHSNIDAAVKRRAIELLAGGLSMPLLIGDEQTIAGLVGAGIAPADAANYCVIGCNELGVPAKLMYDSYVLPSLKLLHETLVAPDAGGIADMDDLLARLGKRVEDHLRRQLARLRDWRRQRLANRPTPFTSSLMDGCIARGTDLHDRLTYPHWTMTERGLTNILNSLAAIEQVAFTQRSATIGQIADALRANFAGAGALRSKLLGAPRWGGDDDRADAWAQRYLQMRDRILHSVAQETGSPPQLVCHVIRSLHHLDGRAMPATPDGRLAGEPLADSIGPQGGSSRAGPTALLASVRKLNAARHYSGGYNLNLTLGPGSDAKTVDSVLALTDVFFAQGGQELQIAALDAWTLLKAREHPEQYPGLLVRIAGFNALFGRLSRCEQDELIARAQAVA